MNIIKKKKKKKERKKKDRYKECYTEFIQRNANYIKKKIILNSNTHCFFKKITQKYLIQELI